MAPWAHAQFGKLDRIPKFHYDTAYFINYNKLLAVRLVSPHRLYKFSIKNTTNNAKYTYRPNLHTGIGVGFTYRWLALDLTISPDFTSRNNELYGKTKEFNFQFSFYLERAVIDFQIRRYQGMYLDNPKDFDSSWKKGDPHPQRPDLNSFALSFGYSIPLNWKKYSLRTTLLLDGKLKKSAGSVILYPNFYYHSASADSSMVPSGYEDLFEANAEITKMNFYLFSFAAGYAYTFVIKKFYITLSATPAISFNAGKVESAAGSYGPKPVSFKFKSKAGLGYNTRRWYAGGYVDFDANNLNFSEDLAFKNDLGGFRIFVGYRIKAPEIVKKFIK